MLGSLLCQRYRIVKHLGGGGFGQTYLAEDSHLPNHQICVIKHFKPQVTNQESLESARRLFTREGEVLHKLGEHSQIPRLTDRFEQDREFYLVQEFIDGHDLSKELEPGKRWQQDKIIDLLKDVLSILSFLHAQGVIHRDLKPSNLMRRKDDNRIVLIDFGAVKEIAIQSSLSSKHTTFSIAIGTNGYMPSEQANRKPKPSSDIYALGMIAIQSLTGVAPMDLCEDPGTGEMIWREEIVVDENLANILDKMIRYHFSKRYQSAN